MAEAGRRSDARVHFSDAVVDGADSRRHYEAAALAPGADSYAARARPASAPHMIGAASRRKAVRGEIDTAAAARNYGDRAMR